MNKNASISNFKTRGFFSFMGTGLLWRRVFNLSFISVFLQWKKIYIFVILYTEDNCILLSIWYHNDSIKGHSMKKFYPGTL